MLSRSLQPAAMRVHRSMATARQLEPPVALRQAMPPTGSVVGTGPGELYLYLGHAMPQN